MCMAVFVRFFLWKMQLVKTNFIPGTIKTVFLTTFGKSIRLRESKHKALTKFQSFQPHLLLSGKQLKALKLVSGPLHSEFVSHINSGCSQTSEQLLLVGQDSAKLIEPGHLHFQRRSLRDNRNITTDDKCITTFCMHFHIFPFILFNLWFIQLIICRINCKNVLFCPSNRPKPKDIPFIVKQDYERQQ